METSLTPNTVASASPAWAAELRHALRQLRDQTLIWVLPGLCVAAFVLLSSLSLLPDAVKGMLLGGGLLLLAAAVWAIKRWSYTVAAWLLVLGCLSINLLAVAWGGVTVTLYLLMIPVGLATLVISRLAGVLIAACCTLLLLFAPTQYLPVEGALRATSIFGLWATVGMIWLTLRPLLSVVWRAWSGYHQSRELLEQARDYQQQLAETLEDLANANVQLTKLNQQAQALRQLAEDERRIKEQFVSNVSHELRTPLNMIIGFCEMITQTPESYGWGIPETLLADLSVVLRNSRHLSSLIDDVLDLSQIDAGQMALSKEQVALPEVVEAAVVAIRPLFQSKGLFLKTEVSTSLPLVFCDRTRIREVVLNLLSNAGRFTERGGVWIRAQQDADNVLVSVVDTGPGIAEEDQDKLFRPFEQLDGTIRRRYGGTGLGLSISKNFVELHGGRMWVESAAGQGTTFFFQLPISPPAPMHADVSKRSIPGWEFFQRTRPSRISPAKTPPRLVVMERGGALRRLLSRYLDGVDIVSVPDLPQASEALAGISPQALLVNDPHVAEALQQLNPSVVLPYGVPAIVCSVPGVEQTANALGAVNYLVKPISREVLLSAIDAVASHSAATSEDAVRQHGVRTVLIADDEHDAVQLFQRMLVSSGRGYRVLRAFDGRQALSVLHREPVDIVLLDLVMPEVDGFQVLAEMSRDPGLQDIPVILTSARDPMGQPIVSNAMAVTCRDGLSVQQLLAGIEALVTILAAGGSAVDPTSQAAPAG